MKKKHEVGTFYAFAEGWVYGVDKIRAAADSSRWTLFDSEKISSVENLRKRILSYEQEHSSRQGGRLSEDYSVFVLDDFKDGSRKALIFPKLENARVYDAATIKKMSLELWPHDSN